MLSFKQWLKKQVHRDDSVGDMARDVEQDKNFPRLHRIDKYMMNFEKIKNYLERRGAGDNAINAFRRAWGEYDWYLMTESADLDMMPNEIEYRDRLSRIIECGHEHFYMNLTKEEVIEYLINIARGVSH